MEATNSGRVDHWSRCVESRYRKVINLPFPSMTAASLHTVGHGCRVPLPVELGWKNGGRKPFVQGWTHSEIGFQLHSIPRSKMVRERRGEKVSSLERLNKPFVRDCRAQRW